MYMYIYLLKHLSPKVNTLLGATVTVSLQLYHSPRKKILVFNLKHLTLGCTGAGTGGDAHCFECDANGADDVTCTDCESGYALDEGTCESKY